MKVKKRYDRLQAVFEKWGKKMAKPPRKAACEMVQDIDQTDSGTDSGPVEFQWILQPERTFAFANRASFSGCLT